MRDKLKSNLITAAWTAAPILVGLISAIIMWCLDLSDPADKILYMTGFVFAWSFTFVFTLAALRNRLENIHIEADEAINTKLQKTERNIARQLDYTEVLSRPSPIFVQMRNIVLKSKRFEEDLDHMTEKPRNLVTEWIQDFLRKVEKDIASFAENKKIFENHEGMLADQALVESAQKNLRASTHVGELSTSFWTDTREGEKYHDACTQQAKNFGAIQEDENTTQLGKGVARFFSFDKEITDKAHIQGSPERDIVIKIIKEAWKQQSEGLSIRLLHRDQVGNQKLAKLDILIVDDTLCSITLDLDDERKGTDRTVDVSWQKTEVDSYIAQWEYLWGQAMPIKEFCERYDFPQP